SKATAQAASTASNKVAGRSLSTGRTPRRVFQIAVKVETDIQRAALAFQARRQITASRQHVEVVDEQLRAAAFQRMQHRRQFAHATAQPHLHYDARERLLGG